MVGEDILTSKKEATKKEFVIFKEGGGSSKMTEITSIAKFSWRKREGRAESDGRTPM